MKIECKRCNYKWDYRGKNSGKEEYKNPTYISCPKCRKNINLQEVSLKGGYGSRIKVL